MKTFFVLVFIFCFVLVGIYYYFDGFEDIQITHKVKGPYKIVYQKIQDNDARFDYLVDNLAAYLEREKNIISENTFEFYGEFPGEGRKVHLAGLLLGNQAIKGRLRKDIKLKNIIRTKCVVGSFTYKNDISKIIFDNIKFPEFEEYLDLMNYPRKQMLKIIDKKNGVIEVIIPENEWKIQ